MGDDRRIELRYQPPSPNTSSAPRVQDSSYNTPTLRPDRLSRVLWFKDSSLVPFYAYYIKIQEESGPWQRWSDPKVVEDRAFFHENASPARLELKKVVAGDEGLYKCRVDFKKAPTRISHIRLNVIVPPEKPVITDMTPTNQSRQDRSLRMLGPYKAGEDVKVLCVTLGGNPSPNITWWRDHKIVKHQFKRVNSGKVESSLLIPNVSSADRGSLLTCQADNGGNKVFTSVKLDLHPEIHHKHSENVYKHTENVYKHTENGHKDSENLHKHSEKDLKNIDLRLKKTVPEIVEMDMNNIVKNAEQHKLVSSTSCSSQSQLAVLILIISMLQSLCNS